MVLCFQVCYHVLSTATTNVPDPTLCSKRSPSENKTNRNFENFTSFWLTIIIALWVYPNVKGSVRNLKLNTSTVFISLQFNYSRENIWVRIWVQFHFLYIFVGRVERIYKTSHITMLSFYFFPSDLQSFGDELNRSSKMALQIFELMKIESKYLDISNCVFTMNCSTDKKIVFWSFLGRDFIYM